MIQKNRLPDEYQEVEYLENDKNSGYQYIYTNYLMKLNSILKIDVEFMELNTSIGYCGLFGSQNGSASDKGGYAIFLSTKNLLHIDVGGKAQTTIFEITTDSYSFVFKNNSVVSNGTEYVYKTPMLQNGTVPVTLFGMRRSGNMYFPERTPKMHLFKCSILEDDELIEDLIPCYRKSDNKPGMYDLVSGKFFVNRGTGEFIVGPDVTNTAKHIYKGNYVLPEEYEEVEYLESGYNTRQRIELPYKCNQNSNIDIGFLFNAELRPVDEFVFECRTDVGKDSISVIKTNSNLFRYDFEKSSSRAGTKYVEANKLYTLKTNKNEFALYNNENIVEKIVVPSSTDFNSKNNINLYTNCSGQEFTTNHLRIYYCRITENDELKIDSYPCYRKSDGVKGFYDLVSNTFCPNIDTISTEDFIAGPEVKKKVKFIIKDNRIIFADESLLPSE